MAKQKSARLTDVLGGLNQLCPVTLAESWDNVGLQVGDPQAQIDKILVCLDVEEEALKEAARCGAQLIISHHPLIFRSLKRLTPTDTTGRILFQAIKHDIAVASAHTNLDRAADGLNDWLATRLRLSDLQPLERLATDHFHKLVVYVPVGHERDVMDALFAGGAGHIGAYDQCSFRTEGTGSFRGDDQSQPFIGTPGELEETDEMRLETIVPTTGINKAVSRMLKAHPYEEVAYDLIPLSNPLPNVGLGRIGTLATPLTLQNFARQVKEDLNVTSLRLVGDLSQPISKVAVCGGSGMSTYADAVRQSADCLVTGDVKFHEAQRARAEGIALIDAGHFATEQLMVTELSRRLKKILIERHYPIEIFEMNSEKDPFVTFD